MDRDIEMRQGLCSLDDYVCVVERHTSGDMCIVCPKCGAFRWKAEESTICCHNGKVDAAAVPHLVPHPMWTPLFSGLTPESLNFVAKVRKYNQAFALSSLRSNLDINLASDRDGVYTFRVNGELT